MVLGGACFRVAGNMRNECRTFARLPDVSAGRMSNAKVPTFTLAGAYVWGQRSNNGEHESAYD
ncbi:hypothetical protein StoSoilA2_32110 [Arthrobacter sp. StoSoilA2]|jgi:hypothetical protein|nr:hypothetical protein StoSoilA2_32110 [Arthrobacter sp. StoSoilA2]BCW49365.1 hypothetical protein StoSoilB13_17070 [Arthrobacter sp. StoSoilB13]